MGLGYALGLKLRLRSIGFELKLVRVRVGKSQGEELGWVEFGLNSKLESFWVRVRISVYQSWGLGGIRIGSIGVRSIFNS